MLDLFALLVISNLRSGRETYAVSHRFVKLYLCYCPLDKRLFKIARPIATQRSIGLAAGHG